jgi:hypothetical protein
MGRGARQRLPTNYFPGLTMTAQINVEIAPAEVLRDQLRLSDDDNEIDLELAVDLYGEAVAKALPLNYDIVAPKGGRCLVPAWNGYQFWTVSLGTLATCDGEDDKAQVRGVLEAADAAGIKAASDYLSSQAEEVR